MTTSNIQKILSSGELIFGGLVASVCVAPFVVQIGSNLPEDSYVPAVQVPYEVRTDSIYGITNFLSPILTESERRQ